MFIGVNSDGYPIEYPDIQAMNFHYLFEHNISLDLFYAYIV